MSNELSPDMIWRTCPDCGKGYTLADADENGDCPRDHSDL